MLSENCDTERFQCNRTTLFVFGLINLFIFCMCLLFYSDSVNEHNKASEEYIYKPCGIVLQTSINFPIQRFVSNVTHGIMCHHYIGMPDDLMIGGPPLVNELLIVPIVMTGIFIFASAALCIKSS